MSRVSEKFKAEASRICGAEQVKTDRLSILSYGTDASFYQYLPEIVIEARSEQQVQALLEAATSCGVSLTFRAGGTSLSGQTISDSVIVVIPHQYWKKFAFVSSDQSMQVQPGMRGGEVNLQLRKFGRQIGPDPASVNSAMMGGIVANNASGMRSGVKLNSYHLLNALRIVFADGTILDTEDKASRKSFMSEKKEWIDGISQMRREILSHPDWVEKIKRKYSIKNTIGYGLNSLVDFDDPIDIIAHLMVGSEGTLGFISSIGMKTVPLEPYTATGLLLFNSLPDACRAAIILNENHASAIELIDRKALLAIENNQGIPTYIKGLADGVTALLVDFTALSSDELQKKIKQAQNELSVFEAVRPFEFSSSPVDIARLWNVRKGIFPAVGGNRKAGTTVFIEDVAFHLPDLPQALSDLKEMLERYGYADAVIYGHANDGNVHFIFSEDMRKTENVERYACFMDEVATMVVDKYDGSLKAEHGTGRNMAPYVQKEWGNGLYDIHCRIKKLFDPKGILNPGVMINADEQVHLRNIKYMPVSDPLVDKCVECGFCEVNCLTNGLNMSARQRIIAFRELRRMAERKNTVSEQKILFQAFHKNGVDTCAGDGLCATSCPVGIDTGQLVKKLRGLQHGQTSKSVASWIGNHMPVTQTMVRAGLSFSHGISHLVSRKGLYSLTSAMHRISGGRMPVWHGWYPKSARVKQFANVGASKRQVVYFPSCISQTMGASPLGQSPKSQIDVTLEVLERAGYEIIFPKRMSALCCGTPWESKGFFEVANRKSEELEQALFDASRAGEIPVLIDTSPCLYRMRRVISSKLELYEPVEFALKFLVDQLPIQKVSGRIALHSTCTTTKMGLKDQLLQLGKMLADDAFIPENVGCCGFAGDKGFTQPEINTWALRNLKEQTAGCDGGYSNSRTCEIGLSQNSGIEYRSVFYLLEQASRNVKKG